MPQASAPFRGGPPGDPVEVDDQDRNLPSELRSRPKIPRTPAEGDIRFQKRDQDVPQNQSQEAIVKIKDKVIED